MESAKETVIEINKIFPTEESKKAFGQPVGNKKLAGDMLSQCFWPSGIQKEIPSKIGKQDAEAEGKERTFNMAFQL